ncbi:hypothetical protein Pa4123_08770 [Phytohabitans aurantiacus]|uniref:Uncharacterized protein n=1 Tax=Phytohabitans aurantiacus TaxID=3016789 RepID=A0ABQ5QLM6_9ACTN|nr:hypothetical protein Pa4123_08770 [Phytohabitans aurantiacus]
MTSRRFEEQRAENLERVRRNLLPDSVARLLAVVQEPRCDDEASSAEFDACLAAELTQLRARLDETYSNGTGRVGGIVEAEASRVARALLAAAEAAGMTGAAELLHSALGRCAAIPQQSSQPSAQPEFPQPVRVLDPDTGRPIGLWR